jgi:hypothetical protein
MSTPLDEYRSMSTPLGELTYKDKIAAGSFCDMLNGIEWSMDSRMSLLSNYAEFATQSLDKQWNPGHGWVDEVKSSLFGINLLDRHGLPRCFDSWYCDMQGRHEQAIRSLLDRYEHRFYTIYRSSKDILSTSWEDHLSIFYWGLIKIHQDINDLSISSNLEYVIDASHFLQAYIDRYGCILSMPMHGRSRDSPN